MWANEVRLLGTTGENLGVVGIKEALAKAQEEQLDLVEMSRNGEIPVCRLMDFSKFKYDLTKKEKAQRKKQRAVSVKEIKFGVTIGEHDLSIKLRRGASFLQEGNKLKIVVNMFGRHLQRPEDARELVTRALDLIKDSGKPESTIQREGKAFSVLLTPVQGVGKKAEA